MSKNETGEFELVLGNKQLLSVFFIVVILLGVFFTMGYIVGRNSAPPPLEATNRKPEGRPLIVDSPNAPPPSQIPAATETKPAAVEEPKPVDPPKQEVKQPDPKPEEKKPKEEEKPKPVEKEKEKPKEKKPPAEVPAVSAGGSPAKGNQYLQVQALPTEQANLVLEVFRKKGFPVVTESVPNKPGLTRVLVGPIEPGTSSEMKDKLDQAGFKGKQAILRKF
jgi:cell division septation protein DedD